MVLALEEMLDAVQEDTLPSGGSGSVESVRHEPHCEGARELLGNSWKASWRRCPLRIPIGINEEGISGEGTTEDK